MEVDSKCDSEITSCRTLTPQQSTLHKTLSPHKTAPHTRRLILPPPTSRSSINGVMSAIEPLMRFSWPNKD